MSLYNRKTLSDDSFYLPIPDLCWCGCNNIVYNGRKYISGHNSRGKTNPMYGKPTFGHKGHQHRSESCLKISDNHADVSGYKNPMFGTHRCGVLNPNYIDGRSKFPYCFKWTESLRESVRLRDSYQCQNCGKKQSELSGFYKHLSVHHIHYDKQNCYPDLITLCQSCNSIVNKKSMRSYYESLFMNKLNERNLLFWTLRREQLI